MHNTDNHARISAKAVIIQDGRSLVLKKKDSDGFFLNLPGGGQEHGETIEEALVRECKEEISAKVKMKKLLFIRDYIAVNHEVKEHAEKNIHHVELMFQADIIEGTPESGISPDVGQLSVEWLDLKNILSERLYPRAIRYYLNKIDSIKSAIYLGDVN
ncbi:MAG: NUDIX domain-containing protein [Ignavibacteria bacterium]|nr:NUDIX domain-containing protein [Ignavibacteria bacterium]